MVWGYWNNKGQSYANLKMACKLTRFVYFSMSGSAI
jgi:hypothetical protein